MSDEVVRAADPMAMPFGSSGIVRSRHARENMRHNRWRREALDVCWKCCDFDHCGKPCDKARKILEQKGVKV